MRLFCGRSKKNEVTARLSFFYGFDVSSVEPETRLGLELNLPGLLAQKRIEDGQYDPDDYDAIYDLFMDAYGDDEIALNAQIESMRRVVRRECEAARMK